MESNHNDGRRASAPEILRRLKNIVGAWLINKNALRKLSVVRPEVSAAERINLERIARGQGANFRFFPQLEDLFQIHVRKTAQAARASITLLTLALFATAPLWSPWVLNLPQGSRELTIMICYWLACPVFALAAWLQLFHVESDMAERVMTSAFLIEVAAIEFLIYATETNGFHVSPTMAVTVPVIMLPLSRLRFSRAVEFSVFYFAIVLIREWAWPNAITHRTPTDWMMEFILVTGALATVGFNKLSIRRAWASNLLLDQISRVDALTSLPNRLAFEDHFNTFSRLAAREKVVSILAMIDLDHFKKINDHYGHPYGDGVLSEVALLLSDFARRSTDMAARIGGEEFGLFLYDCDIENGRKRLNNFLLCLRALAIEHASSEYEFVTASAGACVVTEGMKLGDAYHIADECLYRAKLNGRNTLEIAGIADTGTQPLDGRMLRA